MVLGQDRPGTPWTRKPGTSGAYVVTTDTDTLHARAVAAGAEIVEGPIDRDYGSRDFIARDPEGNLVRDLRRRAAGLVVAPGGSGRHE